jgi:hypothetical protein
VGGACQSTGNDAMTSPMDDGAREEQPSEVAVDSGSVIVDGPDGVAVTMSLEAAAETGRRLIDAVEQARGQDGLAKRDGG